MLIVGQFIIAMGIALWAGHTHKAFQPRPPEQCQLFDTRYEPRYKAMCDAWDAQHP